VSLITKSSAIISKNIEFIRVSLILIILTSIFFVRSILFGLMPSPADLLKIWPLFAQDGNRIQNPLMSDVVTQFEPWFIFNYISVHNLQIPLWNPYCAGGVPHIANMQSMFFFPPAWPIYIFGVTAFTLCLLYFIKIYLTGIATYYYLKSINLTYYPSLIGAIAFMFVGYNVVWLYWPHSNVIFVFPSMLYIIEKYIITQHKGYLLALSIITALGIVAGHPETFFHIGFAAFLYFAFRLESKNASFYEKLDIAKGYLFYTLLGFALAAIQLFPFLEYLFNSYAWVTRTDPRYMLDWHTSVLNFIPDFYGSASIHHIIPYYVSFTNYNESASGYVGISMLCFAVFALLTCHRYSLVRFYLLLDIWAICVVYGVPLIYDLTVSLPLFSHAANQRMLFLIGFITTILGSIGLNEIFERSKKEDKNNILSDFLVSTLFVSVLLSGLLYANCGFLYSLSNFNNNIIKAQNILVAFNCILILITFVLIYVVIRKYNNHRLMKIGVFCLILLIFSETGIHGMLYEPTIDKENFYPSLEIFDRIIKENDLYRATSIGPTGSVYPVNTQMIYSIFEIRDYDALEIRHYRELFDTSARGLLQGWMDLYDVDKRFLDYMGVKWIFSRNDISKEIDINFANSTNAVGELNSSVVVEQEFISQKANLSKIELFFATYLKDSIDSNIRLELIDKDTRGVVRVADFNTSTFKDNHWYPAPFEPIANSSNRTYILKISSDGTPGNSITVYMNNAENNPTLIELHINGIVVPGSLCLKTYHEKKSALSLVFSNPEYYVFKNSDAMPRAYFVRNAIFRQNNSDILKILKGNTFDEKSSVVIAGKDHIVRSTERDDNSSVDILEYKPTYIKIKVNTQVPGFLVLSDAFYPGWVANLNGSNVEILRANYAFRSILIDRGESVIEFKYTPIVFYAGAGVSLLAFLVLFMIFFRDLYQNYFFSK